MMTKFVRRGGEAAKEEPRPTINLVWSPDDAQTRLVKVGEVFVPNFTGQPMFAGFSIPLPKGFIGKVFLKTGAKNPPGDVIALEDVPEPTSTAELSGWVQPGDFVILEVEGGVVTEAASAVIQVSIHPRRPA